VRTGRLGGDTDILVSNVLRKYKRYFFGGIGGSPYSDKLFVSRRAHLKHKKTDFLVVEFSALSFSKTRLL